MKQIMNFFLFMLGTIIMCDCTNTSNTNNILENDYKQQQFSIFPEELKKYSDDFFIDLPELLKKCDMSDFKVLYVSIGEKGSLSGLAITDTTACRIERFRELPGNENYKEVTLTHAKLPPEYIKELSQVQKDLIIFKDSKLSKTRMTFGEKNIVIIVVQNVPYKYDFYLTDGVGSIELDDNQETKDTKKSLNKFFENIYQIFPKETMGRCFA
ncbi:MAG: hypothetical protein RR034_07265 [Bacteroidales bacterium]